MSDPKMPPLPDFENTPSETYDAYCHCGDVHLQVTLYPPFPEHRPVSCNCSICSRHGYMLVYPRRQDVRLLKGETSLKTYTFGRKKNLHKFCSECGSSVFFDPELVKHGEGGGWDLLGINIRMIKGIKLDELQVHKVDGYNEWPFVDSPDGKGSHLR